MASTNFGFSTDVTPQPASFMGMAGWWTVPCGWFCWTDTDGVRWASPNEDHSTPNYACKLDLDGVLKFQDMMAARIAGS